MKDPEKPQFHIYCQFCSEECEKIESSSDYLLITNVWNESENVEKAFSNLMKQTKLPKIWLWMEDGSTDGTYEEIKRCSVEYPGLLVLIERMPRKTKPNFFSLGKTHERIMGRVREQIRQIGIDYVGIMDVDTEPCPNYFTRLCSILDEDRHLGAISGYPIGEWAHRVVAQPMNTGKVIRWNVVEDIKEYWDFCPDTFYNIKAMAAGYDVDVFKVPVHQNRPSTNTTPYGVRRMGRVAYYGGRPFWAVLYRAIRRQLIGEYGTEMLRGYLSEWIRGTWHTKDHDVIEFFKDRENPLTIARELLRVLGKRRI